MEGEDDTTTQTLQGIPDNVELSDLLHGFPPVEIDAVPLSLRC